MKKSVTTSPKIMQLVLCLLLITSLLACAPKLSFKVDSDASLRTSLEKPVAYPSATFLVLSDPHLYDVNLGTSGKAYHDYLVDDRKLITESQEVLETAVTAMVDMKADFVLIPGDMTKDGERQCHLLMTTYLARLKASGKKVFVVPGNHDILNGHSYRYVGDGRERVPDITAQEFLQIYNDYGFKDALDRDTDSLSYVAEPVSGLWLLALDSARYRGNVEDKSPITGGKFSPATMTWIETMLIKAAQQNKAVMVMMHHGAMEHYPGQAKTYGEYVVDNYEAVSRLFADYNVRMVFTGHFHAQDITLRTLPDARKFIFDIETGSLVTSPSPYRAIQIGADQRLAIKELNVTSIKSHPADFPQFEKSYLHEGIAGIAVSTMTGLGVSKSEAEIVSGQIADAFVAHYAGDEKLAPGQVPLNEKGLGPMGWAVIQFYKPGLVPGLWNDFPPPDNNVTLDLTTGSWK